jgi:hypothetical protein
MKYCSRHNMRVMLAASLLTGYLFHFAIEDWLIAHDFSWKQLVLPEFDLIMGV